MKKSKEVRLRWVPFLWSILKEKPGVFILFLWMKGTWLYWRFRRLGIELKKETSIFGTIFLLRTLFLHYMKELEWWTSDTSWRRKTKNKNCSFLECVKLVSSKVQVFFQKNLSSMSQSQYHLSLTTLIYTEKIQVHAWKTRKIKLGQRKEEQINLMFCW